MRPLFLSLFILLSIGQVSAQKIITKNHFIPLSKNPIINIELEGEIHLNSWDMEDGEIDIETITKGRVWGYSNDLKRTKKYDVIIEKSDDFITIREKQVKSSIKIGIVTYRVKHRHYIYLPNSARITLNCDDADIRIKGSFKALTIYNKTGNTELKVNKDKINFLGCFAPDGKIEVNNSKKNKQFTLMGEGSSTYSITTNEGKIDVNLIQRKKED